MTASTIERIVLWSLISISVIPMWAILELLLGKLLGEDPDKLILSALRKQIITGVLIVLWIALLYSL